MMNNTALEINLDRIFIITEVLTFGVLILIGFLAVLINTCRKLLK